jgi:triphosphoribosyl-dephospho-CoA synthase
MRRAAVEAAFRAACADELAAPKPGNVHVHAGGHNMAVDDFLRSAEAAAPALCREGARLGERVLEAVIATRAAVGQNTNLGIVLLCAPLAMAAEASDADLQPALERVLERADLADADAVFRAITLAAPGGLGSAPAHDVRAPATVLLPVAMAAAAGRDRIAWQLANRFADVFDIGVPSFLRALDRWRDSVWAVLSVYLRFLAAFPDSHVVRKHGIARAEKTRLDAVSFESRLQHCATPALLLPELLAWDASLKAAGVNPGTSADLTVATIFAQRLQNVLRGFGNRC